MPLRRRRRLVRAAAVGGTAYMAGRHAGRSGAEEEYEEAPAAPAAAAAAPPTTDADRIKALKDLKDLLDAGAINQYEFDREKDRLLHADG
jgi:hypothetical protein